MMSDSENYTKTPRLYLNQPIAYKSSLTLSGEQIHYLYSVMRKKAGDKIRIFNGEDGEWAFEIEEISKKSASLKCHEQIISQPPARDKLCLIFSPLPKSRQDFLIEKAVELGVTHLQPAISENTQIRKINRERINAQIIEASEQCERLDIPVLAEITDLNQAITKHNLIYAALERMINAPHISELGDKKPCALLIGPAGGFTANEHSTLNDCENIIAVSLGPQILRAETAALYGLAHLH